MSKKKIVTTVLKIFELVSIFILKQENIKNYNLPNSAKL